MVGGDARSIASGAEFPDTKLGPTSGQQDEDRKKMKKGAIRLILSHNMCQILVFLRQLPDAHVLDLHECGNYSTGICSCSTTSLLSHSVSTKVNSCFLAVQTCAVTMSIDGLNI